MRCTTLTVIRSLTNFLMLHRVTNFLTGYKNRNLSTMSEVLCKAFNDNLNLNTSSEPKVDLKKYSDVQQAQIRQWETLSQRFPTTFPELNDTLREETYILGGVEPTEADAYVLARASSFLPELTKDQIVENRHIFRWADLIQRIIGKEVVKVDLDLPAPREIQKKEKKKDGDAKADKKADKKAEKKGDKKGDKKDKDATAAAAGGEKKEKKEKAKKAQPAAAPARPLSPGQISLRVGFIEKAVKHPDADSLYVSTINVGEEEPRTICSGLVKYVPIEDMQKRHVVVVANLKPVKMRGIVSNGMVLCASKKEDDKVEFVKVPEGAQAGDKLFFEDFNEEPETVLNPKKKIWESIQPDFTTNDQLDVVYKRDGKEHKLVTEKGQPLTASTLKGASVS